MPVDQSEVREHANDELELVDAVAVAVELLNEPLGEPESLQLRLLQLRSTLPFEPRHVRDQPRERRDGEDDLKREERAVPARQEGGVSRHPIGRGAIADGAAGEKTHAGEMDIHKPHVSPDAARSQSICACGARIGGY
jgi:hypothetical protein